MGTVYDCRTPADRAAGLAAAASLIRGGWSVVFPTDTVYGIGCDPFSVSAVSDLLAAKGRTRGAPLPVLVGSWTAVDGLAQYVSREARDLIEAFWPGGLSLVLNQTPSLTWDLGDSKGTVTVRMPLHPVALDLLRDVGPMAVSMATGPAATGPVTTIEDARAQLAESVGAFLDSGPLTGTGTSTIVDLTGDEPRLLREGSISRADLNAVLGREIVAV
ncbi:MAG: L-threonylcarbamoyladenylate synthase [Labedaea sp.]